MKKCFKLLTLIVAILGTLVSCNSNKATINNLKTAISTEVTSQAKYAAYADRAEMEGHPEIAALFRATSKAEGIHISNHQKALQELSSEEFSATAPIFEVDSTFTNLESALIIEQYKSTQIYPEFIQIAKKEKSDLAAKTFTQAFDAERKHAMLYTAAIQNILIPNNTQPTAYFICPTCGNVDAGGNPKMCSICGVPGEKLEAIHAVVALKEPLAGTPVAEL